MTDDQTTDTTTEEALEVTQEGQEGTQDEQETFPAEYVRQLRQEAAEARVKAKRADDLARQLFHSRVAATGKLADPSDLDFSEDLLDDMPGLEAAIEDLLDRRPHLASRTPRGDVGQGMAGSGASVDLAGILRARA